jgi:hypothetical protein
MVRYFIYVQTEMGTAVLDEIYLPYPPTQDDMLGAINSCRDMVGDVVGPECLHTMGCGKCVPHPPIRYRKMQVIARFNSRDNRHLA